MQYHEPLKHVVCWPLSLSGTCWKNQQTWLQCNDPYAVRHEPRLREQQFLQYFQTLRCFVSQGAYRYSRFEPRPVLGTRMEEIPQYSFAKP